MPLCILLSDPGYRNHFGSHTAIKNGLQAVPPDGVMHVAPTRELLGTRNRAAIARNVYAQA